jgi:hypothetical protein
MELYTKLSRSLLSNGISSLRISYRHPRDLDECVIDVIAGMMFLKKNKIQSVGLVHLAVTDKEDLEEIKEISNMIFNVEEIKLMDF